MNAAAAELARCLCGPVLWSVESGAVVVRVHRRGREAATWRILLPAAAAISAECPRCGRLWSPDGASGQAVPVRTPTLADAPSALRPRLRPPLRSRVA